MSGRRSGADAGDVEALVADALRRADAARMLRLVERLATLDRYQASAGIGTAARIVADAAREAGLADVAVIEHACLPDVRWWSFAPPQSWTPLRAVLTIAREGCAPIVLDHGREPFTIATHARARDGTRPVSPARRRSRRRPVRRARRARRRAGGVSAIRLDALADAGAAGLVTDAGQRADADGQQRAGRLELPPRSPLFGFCTTSAVLVEDEEKRCDPLIVLPTAKPAKIPVTCQNAFRRTIGGMVSTKQRTNDIAGAHAWRPSTFRRRIEMVDRLRKAKLNVTIAT